MTGLPNLLHELPMVLAYHLFRAIALEGFANIHDLKSSLVHPKPALPNHEGSIRPYNRV
jgi:hypothetical protein